MPAETFRIIRSSRRRQIALRIAADGQLEVLAPSTLSDACISEIVAGASDIIARLRRKSAVCRREYFSFTENSPFPLLGKNYPLHLSCRLRLFDGERFIVPNGDKNEIRSSLLSLYREIAASYLKRKLDELSAAHGIPYSRMRISNASARWGSCNSQGNIAFSWKLIQCPPPLVDYVICHELAHIRELNHSPRFWQTVEKMLPDYRQRRAALTAFSKTLPHFGETP